MSATIPPIASTDFTGDTLSESHIEYPATELLFLPGLDSSYNRETRAFVLRKHFRRKRVRTAKRPLHPSHRARRLSSDDTDIEQLLLSPVHNFVGQTRADPFQSYVRVLTSFEHKMLDQWMQMPYLDHNVTRASCLNTNRDLMHSCVRQDEGLLNAAICYGIWMSQSKGIAVDQRQALQCRQSLYANINHRVYTEGRNPSSELVMLVAAIITSLHETSNPFKDPDAVAQEVAMHVKGLRSLIRAKGWYAATTSFKELSWLCIWADMTVNGELSIGSILPPADPFLSFSSSQYGCFPVDLCLILYADEFVRAYAAFRHTALVIRQIASSSSNVSASCHPVGLFCKGSHVYQLIETGVTRNARPICALLLVHLILEFCQTQSLSSQFELFTVLQSKLDSSDAFRNGSVEATIWGLMTDMRTRTLWHRGCLEILVRHLYVESRLSTSTQRKLMDTLLEFLDVGPATNEVSGKRLELTWWTPEAFRNIVYRELGYKCHDLPENQIRDNV